MLNIDLNALARMGHLFIRLWDVFRIGRFDRKALKTFQNTPQPSNRTRVTALTELHSENNEASMGISAPHIADQLKLLVSMLVRMMMGPTGTIAKRVPSAIIAVFPAIDVLTIGFVLTSSFSDTMLFSVTNQR